jgi:hypothetical protein
MFKKETEEVLPFTLTITLINQKSAISVSQNTIQPTEAIIR